MERHTLWSVSHVFVIMFFLRYKIKDQNKEKWHKTPQFTDIAAELTMTCERRHLQFLHVFFLARCGGGDGDDALEHVCVNIIRDFF